MPNPPKYPIRVGSINYPFTKPSKIQSPHPPPSTTTLPISTTTPPLFMSPLPSFFDTPRSTMSSPSPQPPQLPQQPPQTPPSPPIPTGIPTHNPNPNPSPPIIQALSYSPLKKPQPLPWSHEETLNLIKAYQEKWYSLKRGQLKASQWEEVAVTVAARCGLDEPSKSGTQCRHKIEKLRKRFRAEKQKLPPLHHHHQYSHHPWIYFSLMDQLERGPLPISAVAPSKNVHQQPELIVDSEEDDDDDRGAVGYGGCLLRLRGENTGHFKKRKGYWEAKAEDEMEEDEGEEERERRGGSLMGELAVQMREFAERFVRLERKKIEMMRETARFRIDMENKKREMILVSQHKTLEVINNAFGDCSSQKKMKMKMTQDL